MAKNRNKGFSLIEVIIGVAVLTILLTPVVKQLAQTLKTNRLAKELQYANENAASLMEYTQKVSFDELKTKGSSGDIYLQNLATDNPIKETITCEILVIVEESGVKKIKPISEVKGSDLTVEYTAQKFIMNDVELGSRRTNYKRTVILDDLFNKVGATKFTDNAGNERGLRVCYKYVMPSGEALPEGYEYTNEGSIVKYSDDGLYVKGVVCELRDEDDIVSDPNATPLASMHDLVRDQVALVNGDISNFDKQAAENLVATYTAFAKEKQPERYQQIIGAGGQALLDSLVSTCQKKTTIKIDQVDVDTTEAYYLVKVDVQYSIPPKDGFSYDVSYNVYSQKFTYYLKDAEGNSLQAPDVPAVYIEYQPFLGNTGLYAQKDYIFVENYVDEAKIYFYRPAKDYMYVSSNTSFDPNTVNTAEDKYDRSNDSDAKVDIYLNAVYGSNSKGINNKSARTYVYTNMNLDLDGTLPEGTDVTAQEFDLVATGKNPGQFKLGETGYEHFKVKIESPTATEKASYNGASNTAPILYLLDLDKDTTLKDRIYTATIIVESEDDTVNVKLTGAKGGK